MKSDSKLGVELPHFVGRWADFECVEIDIIKRPDSALSRPTGKRCRFFSDETYSICGRHADYIVGRISRITGNVYTDYVCLHHAKILINPNA